jgi:hypothetical protein
MRNGTGVRFVIDPMPLQMRTPMWILLTISFALESGDLAGREGDTLRSGSLTSIILIEQSHLSSKSVLELFAVRYGTRIESGNPGGVVEELKSG